MLTDWFPGAKPPVRAGVYQIMSYNEVFFSYFDGERWSWGYRSPVNVKPEQKRCSPPYRWRGLAKPSEQLQWHSCYA